MSKHKENRCPGCSKHCPCGAVKCKYGRKYFKQHGQRPARKWESYVSAGGAAWQLLETARQMKKALKKGAAEEAVLGALNEQERAQLCALLGRLCAQDFF